MEFQIPIPALASDPTQPDYSIVQRAWWDIINLCYAEDDTPMRLTLELRIMGDSKLIMAPQHGNTFGTASIEVISIPDAVSDNEVCASPPRYSLFLGSGEISSQNGSRGSSAPPCLTKARLI